jgi:hypothetical protein
MQQAKVYLGDSVYAEALGNHLVLTTENGKVNDPFNCIHLEPEVIAALLNFLEQEQAAGTIPVTLYYHQHLYNESLEVKSYEYTYEDTVVLVGKREIFAPAFPKLSREDLIKQIAVRLCEKQQKIQAEAFKAVQEIEEKIQTLLALPAPTDDIPF